jgi:chromosome segregation ATPase
MIRKRNLGLLAVASAAMLIAAVAATPEPPREQQAPDLAQGVSELNRSMKEIAALLRQQLEKQQTDLLMKRLEISERALSAREQDLRSAESEKSGVSEGLKEIQARLDQLDDESDEASAGGLRRENPDVLRMRTELELQQKLLKDRLSAVDQRALDLENDVADLREEIRGWKELVDRALGVR